MRKILVFFTIFYLTIQTDYSSAFEYGDTSDGFKYIIHHHSESSYQHAWCSAHNGIEEYENSDKTRVDCLTDTHAIEFDFANKWAESIGQALHYSFMTGKRAKIILILENLEKQMCYFERIQNLGKIHNFDVEYVTPELSINRYAPKNADKVRERITLTGWNFVPVEWDSEQNKYIDKETEEQSA